MNYLMLTILAIAYCFLMSSAASAREFCYPETYYERASGTFSGNTATIVWRAATREKCVEIPDGAPNPTPPPPPPTPPPPPPTPPPTPDPEEEKENCVNDAVADYEVCMARTAGTYYETMEGTCAKLGTVQIGANGAVINGSFSYDEFNVCKSVAEARREAFYSDCKVNKAKRIQQC